MKMEDSEVEAEMGALIMIPSLSYTHSPSLYDNNNGYHDWLLSLLFQKFFSICQ